jgi:pimeloyl-ACP methyl ester carboxylesterase
MQEIKSSFPAGQKLTLASGWKMHYWDTGPVNGPVILFVHGLGESSEYWLQAIDYLGKQKYRCLAIDLLGYGSSDKPKAFGYSMEEQADTINEFLMQKKIDKVFYMGHSMGGDVGMALLMKYPGVFKNIILLDTTLDTRYMPDIMCRLSKMKLWLYYCMFPLIWLNLRKIVSLIFFEAPDKAVLDMGTRVFRQTSAHSGIRSIQTLFPFLERSKLIEKLIDAPVPHYYIYGTADLRVVKMIQDNHWEDVPWVYAIEGVKHCAMVEAPSAFYTILEGILAKPD